MNSKFKLRVISIVLMMALAFQGGIFQRGIFQEGNITSKHVYAAQSATSVKKHLKKCQKQLSSYKSQLKKAQAEVKKQKKGTTPIAGCIINTQPLIIEESFLSTTYYWVENPKYMTNLITIASGYVKKTGKTKVFRKGYSSYTCVVCKSVNIPSQKKVQKLQKKIKSLEKTIKKDKQKLNEKITLKNVSVAIGHSTKIPRSWKYGSTGNTLKWSSSNSKVAKVNSSGNVTGVSYGTAKISATTSISHKKTTITVTVKKDFDELKLSTNNLVMNTGSKYQMQYIAAPSSIKITSVEWKSDSEDLATISKNGVITTGNDYVGFCTITLILNNYKKATCKLEVRDFSQYCGSNTLLNNDYYDDDTQIDNVYLDGSKKEEKLWYKMTSYNIKEEDNIEETSSAGEWTSSAPEVVTVSQDGKITALKDGNAIITVKTPCGVTLDYTVCVNNYDGETDSDDDYDDYDYDYDDY